MNGVDVVECLVLSIGKLGRGQENYYLSTVAKGIEDYYTGQGEVAGEWMGAGAGRLGLSGEVTTSQLRAVLAGNNPRDGEALGGRTRRDRVPGWDLTFSAPKSVSVLYALGGDGVAGEVAEAQRAAVAAGVGYLERHATVSRRRIDGEVEVVRAEGLVVGAFRHRTSRAGDPQLHTHCLAANVVERVDGGWGALHSPVVYRHARTAGYVYQAVLRAELTERLGVAWMPVVKGAAEIDGVDEALLERFSKRRAEIEAAMAERGETSSSAGRVAALDTRRAKDYDVDPETLADRWREEAAEVGFTPRSLRRVLGRPAPRVRVSDLDAIAEHLAGPYGLTAEQASFEHRDVVRAWCEELPAGAPVDLAVLEELAAGFVEDGRVVPVVDGHGRIAGRQLVPRGDGTVSSAVAAERRWSTVDMLSVEASLLDRAARGRSATAGQVDASVIDTYLAHRASLSQEQADLVREVCGSGHAVDVVVGRAGTGKTYALAAAAAVWRRGGYEPIGVALAARAAAELETTAGIPSSTLAQFLTDTDRVPLGLDRHHVVVVDESGMVDTRRMARLVAHAEAAGAKVVLVGDHHQLPAVDAGGALRSLVHRHGAVELTENRRQQEPWERATLAQLRSGRGGRTGMVEIVDRYDGRGRLHVGATPNDVRAAMVADWYEARQAGQDAVMLALRRADVAQLNASARARLVADGSVAPTGIEVAGRTFAAGDRVVCLRNDRRLGVHNAMFGTVTATHVDDGLVVETEVGGHHILVPISYLADEHVDHAYATTIHKSQGATYDRTLLLGDERLYRQAGYTALSRGRIRNDLYVVADDDRDLDVELEPHGRTEPDPVGDRLVRTLTRNGAKRLATDDADRTGPVLGDRRTLAELWDERDRLAAAHTSTAVDQPTRLGPDGDEPDGGQGGAPGSFSSAAASAVAELDATIERRAGLAGQAAEIDRPDHIVGAIGAPPADLAGRARWRTAAAAMESYLARWHRTPDLAVGAPRALSEPEAEHLAEVRTAVDHACPVDDSPSDELMIDTV